MAGSSPSLDAMLARAARVVVREGGVADGRPLGTREVLTLSGPDVVALGRALAVREGGEPFHGMCRGDYALLLHDAGGAVVGVIGLHHGQSIRVEGWESDAWLERPEALLDLLAARGLEAPRTAWRAAREAAAVDDARHRRWMAGMPVALAPYVATLVGPMGLSHPRAHPAVGAAADALAAALGGPAAAARALLAWLALADSSWWQYPSEEGIPLDLLDRLGPEAIVKALDEGAGGNGSRDDRLWCAAGRALAHGAWSRRRAREACLPIAAELAAVVERRLGEAARRRVEHVVLPPPRAAVVGDDIVSLGTAEHQVPSALAVGPWAQAVAYVIDGTELARFDEGGRRQVVATVSPGAVGLAADASHLLVTDMTAERVTKIARADGGLEVLAEAEPRPMYPGLRGGRATWLACPFELNPDGVTSSQTARVRVHEAATGARTLAAWGRASGAGGGWDATPTEDGVGVCMRVDERGVFGGTKAVTRLRMVGWDGRCDDRLVLAERASPTGHVRLARAHEAWVWTSADGRELWRRPDGGRRHRRARLGAEAMAITADARGAVVVVRDGEHAFRVLDVPSFGGPVIELARYQAPAWHRPQVACNAAGVFFVVEHELLLAPR
ncbi:MAG: hypothetical protein U1F43_34505 [Myxococcota bacterium]